MKITINGKKQDVNIGCRTFISINELLAFFPARLTKSASVDLNGNKVLLDNFINTFVKDGDQIHLNGQ